MDLVIGKAELSDAEDILALQKLAYQSEAVLYQDWSIQPLTQTMEEICAEFNNQIFLKTLADGKLVGSVRAEQREQSCFIGKLMVHPNYRRRGIARRLMESIEAEFPAVRRFEVFTGEKSEANISLYQSLNYKVFLRKELTPGLALVYLEKCT